MPTESPDDPTLEERIAARLGCTRWLSHGHRPHRMRQELAALAAAAPEDPEVEGYGTGGLIRSFEAEMAELLGTEAAVFMPSGTMAQPIALRVWCDQIGSGRVGFHPTCHLERHEHKGYAELHGLSASLLGAPTSLFTLADLRAAHAATPLGAVLIELPQREIGGQLPSWGDLVATCGFAREAGIRLHLDGARLWECAPFYGKTLSEMAALFDSVYVSFYKTLGAIAGAVLAGPRSFIEEARIWQRRQGGNLIYLYPYVVSAKEAVAERLGEVAGYCERAGRLARVLGAIDGIDVLPAAPPTNMMHVFLRGDKPALELAAYQVAVESGVWLFGGLRPSGVPHVWKLELVAGPSAMEISDDEVGALMGQVMARAGRRARGSG